MRTKYLLRKGRGDDKTAVGTLTFYTTWNAQKYQVATNIHIKHQDWDFDNKQPKRPKEAIKVNNLYNLVLEALENATKQKPGFLSKEEVEAVYKQVLTGEVVGYQSLSEFKERFLSQILPTMRNKNKRPISTTAREDYRRMLTRLLQFRPGLDWHMVTRDFAEAFDIYLQDVHKLSYNSRRKEFRKLSAFMALAKDRYKLHENTDYKHFDKKDIQANENFDPKIALNKKQVNALTRAKLPETLDRSRDLFLALCWTGLRISDLDQVKAANIENNALTVVQSKTGGKVVIPVLEPLRTILNKRGGQLPPVLSGQKLNKNLQALTKGIKAFQAPIEVEVMHEMIDGEKVIYDTPERREKPLYELMTSHVGRRTFATRFYYEFGFPESVIRRVTGHSSSESFNKYIKFDDKSHIDLISRTLKTLVL